MEKYSYLKHINLRNEANSKYSQSMKTPSFQKMYSLLLQTDFSKSNLEKEFISYECMKRDVIDAAYILFDGVDLKVKWNEYSILLNATRENVTYQIIDIFNLPIYPADKNNSQIICFKERYGCAQNIIFSHINLYQYYSPLLIRGVYLHEIAHGLIERFENAYTATFLEEYVSFCFQLASSYLFQFPKCLEETYKDLLSRRKSAALYKERIEQMKEKFYLIAFLLAVHTIETYLDFKQKQKEEMLMEWKTMLNGKQSIEDFLGKYDISFENPKMGVSLEKAIEKSR